MKLTRSCLVLVAVSGLVSCGNADPGSGGKGGAGGDVDQGGAGGGGGKGGGGGTNPTTGGSSGTGGTQASSGGSGGGGSGDASTPPATGSYFPFKEGNTWTYEVKDTGVTSYKTQTILGLEKVGRGPTPDAMANKVLTEKRNTATGPVTDKTESWQAVVGSKLVRYRELAYQGSGTTMTVNEEDYWDPYKVRLDEKPNDKPLAKDLTWTESYKETKQTISVPPMPATTLPHTDTWKVVEIGIGVTVKAGTFKNCVQVQKTSSTVAMDAGKSYWFCPGVGKVKEASRTGTSTEELTAYQLK